MPNIPLIAIPNAPKTGGTGLAGANYKTHPVAPTLKSGKLDYSSAIAGVQPVMHPDLKSNAKAQMAAGQALGASISQVGAVIGKINDEMMKSTDLANAARVDNYVKGASQALDQQMTKNPDTEQWGKMLATQVTGLKKNFGGLENVSPRMAQHIEASMIEFQGGMERQMSSRAKRNRRESDKHEMHAKSLELM